MGVETMRTPEEVADVLCKLYRKDFGNGTLGRYKINRTALKDIAGKSQLRNVIIDQISDEMFEKGYLFTEISNDIFVIINENFINKFRTPPQSLLSEYCCNRAADSKNDPEDEDE